MPAAIKLGSHILVYVLGIIFFSLTVAWCKRADRDYMIIQIKEWKRLWNINERMKKEKVILERRVIKAILDEGVANEQ